MMESGSIRGGLTAIVAAVMLVLPLGMVRAQTGDADKGEIIYAKRCQQCHGEEGDGLGPGAERLNPPPRDFTLGLYKFKSTAFDEDFPNDSDLIRMIRDGMPGTAMPGWSDLLSEGDIRDVTAYIKLLAELEDEPEGQIDYGTQVTSSPESIAAGKKLFHDDDRCSECHGSEGKGDAVKMLKDDNGDRTWPRNLTKPWTFRAGNEPKDIFSRISAGIPTTQMPSFADPKSKKKLSVEERWHVANYVASLAKKDLVVRPENTVIQAARFDGELPASPDDEVWNNAPPSTFFLVPQIVGKDRFFTATNDTISVRALYNDDNIGILLEWDDRTKSNPGDPEAEKLANDELFEDAIAAQFPVKLTEGMEKPYFLMGNAAKPVNLWRWSSGSAEDAERVELVDAAGIANQVLRDDTGGLTATGSYKAGTWRVAMIRPLATGTPERDLQFEEGRFIPISLFVWDGSNDENGTSHTMTTWYWLLLKPAASSRPILVAILIALLLGAALIWWARSAAPAKKGKSS